MSLDLYVSIYVKFRSVSKLSLDLYVSIYFECRSVCFLSKLSLDLHLNSDLYYSLTL
jgi:hypothetical protein